MNSPAQCVFVANGDAQAQQVRAFLGAAGIPTAVRGEALRNTHGLTLNGLGSVEILVAESDVERARALLGDAEAGRFQLADDVPASWTFTSMHIEDVAGRTDASRQPPAEQVERSLFDLLDDNVLCSIATVTPQGQPHINTAYFSYTGDLTLYFLSHPGSSHCRNLQANRSMAMTVFSSTQQWTQPGRGVQLFGIGERAEGAAAERAERSYAGRFPAYARWKDALAGHEPGRLYRFYCFRVDALKIMDERRLGDATFVHASVRRE